MPSFQIIQPKQPHIATNQGVIYALSFFAEKYIHVTSLFQIHTRLQTSMAHYRHINTHVRKHCSDSLSQQRGKYTCIHDDYPSMYTLCGADCICR